MWQNKKNAVRINNRNNDNITTTREQPQTSYLYPRCFHPCSLSIVEYLPPVLNRNMCFEKHTMLQLESTQKRTTRPPENKMPLSSRGSHDRLVVLPRDSSRVALARRQPREHFWTLSPVNVALFILTGVARPTSALLKRPATPRPRWVDRKNTPIPALPERPSTRLRRRVGWRTAEP